MRGWLRQAAGWAERVREVFTRMAAVSADLVPLEPAGSPLADALVAVAATAAAGRWPLLLTVSPWEIASAVTNATLLSPVMAAAAFNASFPLGRGRGWLSPSMRPARGHPEEYMQ